MVTQAIDIERATTHRPYVSMIRWSAVFAGSVVGIATYLLLNLFGLAVGLSAVQPQAAEPLAGVSTWTGVWSGISLLIAAFLGGYVAGKMSGLSRLADGLLHGFVSWATITVFFAYLTTTAAGALIGGTMGILGQSVQVLGQVDGTGELQRIITGSERAGSVTPAALASLRERLQAQDRTGAVSVMVNQMGFSQERASEIVNQVMPLFGPQAQQRIQEMTSQTISTITAASWYLFFALILSLGVGMWGGAIGTRTTSHRAVGDHTAERHLA